MGATLSVDAFDVCTPKAEPIKHDAMKSSVLETDIRIDVSDYFYIVENYSNFMSRYAGDSWYCRLWNRKRVLPIHLICERKRYSKSLQKSELHNSNADLFDEYIAMTFINGIK